MMLLLLAFFVTVSVCLWCWWLRIIKSGSGPFISGWLPVIGHTHKVVGDTQKLWTILADISKESTEHGGVSRMIFLFENYYVITDPEDIVTAGNCCIQKHYAFEFAKQWLGDGLITSAPPVWRRHRKLLNPAFTMQLLYGYIHVFNEESRELVNKLAERLDKDPFDVSSYFRKNAMNALCQTALGITGQDNSGLFQKYLVAADEILELIVMRFQNCWLQSNLIYKLTGLKKKEGNLIKVLNWMSDSVIKEKRLKMANPSDNPKIAETSGLKHKAFLDLLLEPSADNTLTDKEIREEVDSIIVAGTDTSSWLVTYTCVVLGTYPDIQEKIVDELLEVFGDSDRDVDKDDLQKLVYMEAVIKETLRLYTVAPVTIRTAETGVKLKNHYVRPGDHVIMSFYGVNRHPVWGPDADQFRPERWLESDSLPTVYGGFGIGKRACIGRAFAMMSMKTLLAHMLRRYRVFGDVTNLKLKLDFIAKPVSGHLITISERNYRAAMIRKQA